jgi:hypothetical protein
MPEQPNPEGFRGPGSIGSTLPSGPELQPAVGVDNQPFGALLAPALIEACAGRLSDIRWFRADWQRGGALTGFAQWQDDDQVQREAVVKLPVPPVERTWLGRLSNWPDIAPKVYAHGQSLGRYDIAWVVMERIPHGPLSNAWDGAEFDLLVEAVGRFYAVAATFPVDGPVRRRNWQTILERARKAIAQRDLAQGQRWQKALKKAQRKVKDWQSICEDRPNDHWCHGDLHLGNAMTRAAAPQGPAVLLDFAAVHLGNWVEDGIYCEHLFWSRRKRLGEHRLCSMIAKQRKSAGLPVADDWPRWASTQRALLAMSTPAIADHADNIAHLAVALEVLEAEVGV